MLQIYSLSHIKIDGLTNYKELKLEREINIDDTLSFLFSVSDAKYGLILEECYIRTKDNEYIVKEVNYKDDDWTEYICKINIEGIKGKDVSHFETIEQTCTNSVNLALVGTGWTIGSCNVIKLRTVRKNKCNAYIVLQEIQSAYGCEMTFDSVNKKVYVYQSMGSGRGTYFAEQLNLKKLDVQRNSYDYITRLIPLGKDGLGIAAINGGLNYIENYQYSNKIIAAYWEDNRYTDAQSLLEDGIIRLDYLSKPYKAYKADVIDLASINTQYNILDYSLGDTITLLAKSKSTKEQQRIIKLTEYPEEPERNTCEIANKILSLEYLQVRFIDTADVVDTVTTVDGLVDGSKVDGIDWNILQNIHVVTADIQDASIVTAKIGELQVTTAKIADAQVTNAKIGLLAVDTANIAVGAITTALIDTAAIGTTQIADGSITDAKIVGLTANKITAGTINAGVITVTNLNAANITVGTINGAQITPGAIGATQLSSTINNAISTAQTTADGKNEVTYSLAVPGMTANSIGDIWFQKDASNIIIGQWEGLGGTSWSVKTIGNTVIANLDAGKLTAGTIAAARISAGSLNASVLTANTITATQIAVGVITATQIAAATITGDKLVVAAITSREIAAKTITANEIVANTITAAEIKAATITAVQIAAGTITTNEIASTFGAGLNISSNTSITLKADKTSLDTTNNNVAVVTTRIYIAEASIVVNANAITSKVEENGVISSINQTAEAITIDASKINLVGAVTVLSEITGNLGTVTAGNISGVTIVSTSAESDVIITNGYILNVKDKNNPTYYARTYIQDGSVIVYKMGTRHYTYYKTDEIYHQDLDVSTVFGLYSNVGVDIGMISSPPVIKARPTSVTLDTNVYVNKTLYMGGNTIDNARGVVRATSVQDVKMQWYSDGVEVWIDGVYKGKLYPS